MPQHRQAAGKAAASGMARSRDNYLAKIIAKARGDFEGFLRQNKLFHCGAAVLGFCAAV